VSDARNRIAAVLSGFTAYPGWHQSPNFEDRRNEDKSEVSSPFDYAFGELPPMLVPQPLPASTPLARALGEDQLKRLGSP
jgi:hypothetical protein